MRLSNIRRVEFFAYVLEDEAPIIQHELQNLYQRSETMLAGGHVGVEKVAKDDERGKNAVQFFRDMQA